MDTTPVKLPSHEHLLVPSHRHVYTDCLGCNVKDVIYTGYVCSDSMCRVWFHKDCAEASPEINHSSHPQHPLVLTIYKKDYTCDLCGQEIASIGDSIGYHCSTCDFSLDLICGMKPPSPIIENSMLHDHLLVFLKTRKEKVSCKVCKVAIDGPSYTCVECDVYFHLDCIQLEKEVNHHCHSLHPLKFIAYESFMDDAEKNCLLCGRELEYLLPFHCSICNFSICFGCTKNPPPLIIDHTKTHKHPLTLFSRKILFTCNHCGQKEESKPYMCFQCGFVIGGNCVGLPYVININRHDHRISYTHHLGPGYLKCEVCHGSINQYNGGYSCSICPSYVVHSQCAVDAKVWDGVELEGIPEIIEDISPYKVVGDNLIRHVSHKKHILKLHTDHSIYDQFTRCKACIHPVGFEPIYSCEKCCFILHETCANLPLKKRLVFDSVPFTLVMDRGNTVHKALDCELCGILSVGFKYTSQRDKDVDIHCGSLSEPLVHKCHPHPLYFFYKENHKCDGCQNSINDFMLRCDTCDFDLCVHCSSIPVNIRYSNHEHPIILCCGEEASGKYWCDICEKEVDPSKWFYTCDDCGVTIHMECILGDFSRLLPGCIIIYKGFGLRAVVNNHNTRPFCVMCFSRCKFPVILKDFKSEWYLCSRLCMMNVLKSI